MDVACASHRLWGRHLRYVLTNYLMRAPGNLTVADLVTLLEADGFRLGGRPSKTVSDALRWEIALGRVVRTGRSTYRVGHIPRTTAGRIRTHSADLQAAAAERRRQAADPEASLAHALTKLWTGGDAQAAGLNESPHRFGTSEWSGRGNLNPGPPVPHTAQPHRRWSV